MTGLGAVRLRVARRARGARDDGGFTIVESVVALGTLFAVLLGLVAAMTTGVRGVVIGKQRSVATSIANEVLEQARARSYGEVGHAITFDSTLSSDTNLTPVGSSFNYGGELLVGSIVTGNNAPFTPHRWTRVDSGTTYTAKVYVTQVVPTSGDPFKRVTALVSWTNGATGIDKTVRLSTFVYDAQQPPDPLLKGVADADAGSVTLGGVLIGPDVLDAHRWFAYTHGEIDAGFIKRAKGLAITPRTELRMKSGNVTGTSGSCTSVGSVASCGGARAETIADNDAGSTPPEHDSVGPLFGDNTTINSNTIALNSGSTSASSKSTANSCDTALTTATAPCPMTIGDLDGLPYHSSESGGPATVATNLTSGQLTASLLSTNGSCDDGDCSRSRIDVDPSGTSRNVTVTARTRMPAVSLVHFPLNLGDLPVGYLGLVRIGTAELTARAEAGPGAADPTLTAAPVTIQLFDTVLTTTPTAWLVPGYRSWTISPTVKASGSTHADLTVGSSAVSLDASFETFPGIASPPVRNSANVITHAEARAVDWLRITIAMRIIQNNNKTIDMEIVFEYGRVSAVADYRPAG